MDKVVAIVLAAVVVILMLVGVGLFYLGPVMLLGAKRVLVCVCNLTSFSRLQNSLDSS